MNNNTPFRQHGPPRFAVRILGLLLTMLLVACVDNDQNASSNEIQSLVTGADGVATAPVLDGDILPFSKVETHMILGTGSVQGAYFPIGGVICRLLNRHKELHNLRCSVESTAGSIYNLRELREGNFDLVVSQTDWQYHAYNGSNTFEKDGPNLNLRAVFALEADPITLIVNAESDINTLEDLQGRTVSFGYARSLQHRTLRDLLNVMGWTDDNFKKIVRLSDPNQLEALCNDEVEATLFLMSSLDDYLRDHDDACRLKMISIAGDYVKQVIADKPYYRVGTIPAGKYLDSNEDIQSFGLGAVFVASESTSIKAIYNIVKEVAVNIKDFKALHPTLKNIELQELPYAGVAIPLHAGAIRYYREARLLK
ncbi:MAG: TAXI family TRAP transporter solute-binding subunit [Acidiferrobacterales bacterium]|nr:TAXI family TRAP transporter solute-binding subunit [Acidiferrobacterales bacterium]